MSVPGVVLYSGDEAGHRGAYLRFLATILPTERRGALGLFWVRRPVLFLLIEDSFVFFVLIALARALTGRRTVGLLFRPKPALDGTSLRLRGKRLVLKLLRHVSHCRVLTILPFALDPRFAEIADGWIHDFQLWDLDAAQREAIAEMRQDADEGGLIAQIRRAAAGRRIVCAIGRQDRQKGFDRFARIFADHQSLRQRFLFVSGGKVTSELALDLAAFESVGGLVLDRHLSDAELLEFYAAADLIWCHYAPDYDQASGIFGRAAQLGIPVILRAGSLVEAFCAGEGISHVTLEPDRLDCLTKAGPVDPTAGLALATRLSSESRASLFSAFGQA